MQPWLPLNGGATAEAKRSKGHVQEQKVWGDPAGRSQNTDISFSQVDARVFIIQASPISAGDKRVRDSFPAREFLWQCYTNAFWPKLVIHSYWATLGRVVEWILDWESGLILQFLCLTAGPPLHSRTLEAFVSGILLPAIHSPLSLALTLSHVPTCTFSPISWTHST